MIQDYNRLVTRLQKEQIELYKIYDNLRFYQIRGKIMIKNIILKYDEALIRNYKKIEEIISEETE